MEEELAGFCLRCELGCVNKHHAILMSLLTMAL